MPGIDELGSPDQPWRLEFLSRHTARTAPPMDDGFGFLPDGTLLENTSSCNRGGSCGCAGACNGCGGAGGCAGAKRRKPTANQSRELAFSAPQATGVGSHLPLFDLHDPGRGGPTTSGFGRSGSGDELAARTPRVGHPRNRGGSGGELGAVPGRTATRGGGAPWNWGSVDGSIWAQTPYDFSIPVYQPGGETESGCPCEALARAASDAAQAALGAVADPLEFAKYWVECDRAHSLWQSCMAFAGLASTDPRWTTCAPTPCPDTGTPFPEPTACCVFVICTPVQKSLSTWGTLTAVGLGERHCFVAKLDCKDTVSTWEFYDEPERSDAHLLAGDVIWKNSADLRMSGRGIPPGRVLPIMPKRGGLPSVEDFKCWPCGEEGDPDECNCVNDEKISKYPLSYIGRQNPGMLVPYYDPSGTIAPNSNVFAGWAASLCGLAQDVPNAPGYGKDPKSYRGGWLPQDEYAPGETPWERHRYNLYGGGYRWV